MDQIENTNNDENITSRTEKNIIISGTNNRYLIKRANRVQNEIKKRATMNKYNIPQEFFLFDKQVELLKEIYKNENKNNNENVKKIIIKELEKKISSYKQQDSIKKKFDEVEFIDINIIIQSLVECDMKCFYCHSEIFILYEHVRELMQWSVDRVNNDDGHNKNNFVIACLNCNIKRRSTNSNKFLFTKQLNLVKKL